MAGTQSGKCVSLKTTTKSERQSSKSFRIEREKVGVIGDTIAELTNSISHLRRTNEYLKAHKEFKTDLELREAVEENEDLIQRRLEQIKDLKEKMNPHKRALPESRKVVDKRSKVGMHENQGKAGGDKKNMDSDGDEKNKQVKGGFML